MQASRQIIFSRRSRPFRLRRILVLALLSMAGLVTVPAEDPPRPDDAAELFAQIDGMLEEMADITGLKLTRPVRRSVITREEIRELIERRIDEDAAPKQIQAEEAFLKMFGYVDDDFDLAGQFVEVLTEQATALYDYKTKQLYLAAWTPRDLQEAALVHELAHALADQHFDLRKYMKKSKGADGDVARSAVLEGQASWIMIEYTLRQNGQSLLDNSLSAVLAATASRFEAEQYPAYAAAPLYLRESLLFPYTRGLLFQQQVLRRKGKAGFAEVFRNPPTSSQHILEPETYFGRRRSSRPRLPRLRLGRGYKVISKGEVGQLDHAILIEQFFDRETAGRISPHWRGGRYKIVSKRGRESPVLAYAVEWSSAETARRFFDLYEQICRKKWLPEQIEKTDGRIVGRGREKTFILSLDGPRVAGMEGLPNDRLRANTARFAP